MNKRIVLIILIAVLGLSAVYAQANPQNGDYRSKKSGNWNEKSTWSRRTLGSWFPLSINNTPTSSDGTITIKTDNHVTITQGLTIDETYIEPGATLTINQNINLIVGDGPGVDLTNEGTLNINGVLSSLSAPHTGVKHPPYGIVNETTGVINLTGTYNFNFALENKGVMYIGFNKLNGTVQNHGRIVSQRTDIMASGTLTNINGSTIEYSRVLDIPASSSYKRLHLSAPGIYYLEGNLSNVEYLTLGDNTYLHRNGYSINADTSALCNAPERIIDGPLMTLATDDPAIEPGNISQSVTNHPIYKFSLSRDSNPGEVILTGLNFNIMGTATADDLSRFRLWNASSDDFSLAEYQEGQGLDGTGARDYSFTELGIALDVSSTRYFWITADLAATATTDNTIQVNALRTEDIVLTFPTGGGYKYGTAHEGGVQTIIGINTLLSSDNQVPDQGISKNSVKNPIYHFQLQSDGNNQLSGLSFSSSSSGTAMDNDDISRLELYGSIENNLYTAEKIGRDLTSIELGITQTFPDVAFSLLSGEKYYFWITADIRENAVSGHTLIIDKLTTEDNITMEYGNKNKSGSATAGGLQTIVAPTTTLATSNPAIAPATISRGSNKNPIYAFSLTSASSNTLETVSFTPVATSLNADIAGFQLYSSTTNYFDAATQVGNYIEVPLSGGVVAIHHAFNMQHALNSGATHYFWITANIRENATIDNTIKVSALTRLNVKVTDGDVDLVEGTVHEGGVQTIGYPLLMVRTHNPAIPVGIVNIDQMRNPIYRVSMTRDNAIGTVSVTGITFKTTGTYSAENIYQFGVGTNEIDNCIMATRVGQAEPTPGTGTRMQTVTFDPPIEFAANQTRYFWISAVTKFPEGATSTDLGSGNTIQALALTVGDIVVSGGRVEVSAHDGAVQTIGNATVELKDNSAQIEASKLAPGHTKRALQSFTLETRGNITLGSVRFSTGGTYYASDITKFQLWTGIENNLHAASQIGDDITIGLGAGSHSFTGMALPFIPDETHYFWITTDAAPNAVSSNTIYVSNLTIEDIGVSSGAVDGFVLAGGTQTFCHICDWTFAKGQRIPVTENTGSGYQVKVRVHRKEGSDYGEDVHVGEKCRSDFGDIRFFEGDLPLSYWMESMDFGKEATFWVKLDGNLSNADIDLIMRFGHEGATTTSDGTATFEFFDDFNRSDDSLAKWNVHKTMDDSSIFIPTGLNHVRLGDCGTGGTFGHAVLGSNRTYSDFSNGAIEFKYRVCIDAIAEVGFRGVFGNPGMGYKARSDARTDDTNQNGGQSFLSPPYYDWDHLSDTPDPFSDQPVPHKWYKAIITALGDNLTFTREGASVVSSKYGVFQGPGEISLQNHYGDKADYDWIFVRKYTDKEPLREGWRGVPVALSATAINYNGFTARWSECSDATSYTLDVYEANGYEPIITINEIMTNAARVEGLDTNTHYKYRVQAVCNLGTKSPDSNTILQATTYEATGYGETTSILGSGILAYIPPVGNGVTNNNVYISEVEGGSTEDFKIEISYEDGYDIWPNARLLATITATNPVALNRTYTINYEGMGYIPQAAAYRWAGQWHHIEADFREASTEITISGIVAQRSNEPLEIVFDDSSGTLPVEFSSFTANLNAYGKVKIQWVTQSETNVMGFRIYRNKRKDLNTATLLDALIEGTNTSHTQVYIFVDEELNDVGTFHYWIECVDYDGATQVFGPATVHLNGDSDSHNQAPIVAGINRTYPNPFNPDVHIAYGVPEATNVAMRIYNIRGQFVSEILNEYKTKGTHTLTWTGKDSGSVSNVGVKLSSTF